MGEGRQLRRHQSVVMALVPLIELRCKLGIERIVPRIDVIQRRDGDRFGAVVAQETGERMDVCRVGSAA